MACGVCARILDAHTDGGQLLGYVHPRDDEYPAPDHLAVPVRQDQVAVEGLCDFCGDLHPEWAIPVRTFGYTTWRRLDDGREIPVEDVQRNMVGDWAACRRCAGYIERDQWDVMARYAVRRRNARLNQPPDPARDTYVAESLLDFWANTRANITGPPRLITEWKR